MDNFATIKTAFKNAGIDVKQAEYSFTAYSLNTPLSFKFTNADEFIAFLNLDGVHDTTITERLHAMLTEAGLDPDRFFYVNFYKPKVAEL